MRAKPVLYASIFSFLISCSPGNEKLTQSNPFSLIRNDSAQLFFPGMVSTGLYERDLAISPNYDEMFFGVLTGRHTTIMHMKKENGKWTEPDIAPFARQAGYFFLEPAFSPDGNRLYFLSTLPLPGEDSLRGWANQNIWYVERQADGNWGEMKNPGDRINTGGGEFFPSLSNNGNLYFTWNAPGSSKNYIKRALWVDGHFLQAELLPENVCGDGEIFNASISPDESWLIACASGRDSLHPNAVKYYLFFNLGDGKWSDAVDPGEFINLPGSAAISPSVSRDGNYLFFASSWIPEPENNTKKLSREDVYLHYSRPQNGLMDIYIISTGFIKQLKPPVTGEEE